MNLQQIEYIIAVDNLKSFSKAAEYCNVTQATLSAMIKKLEEELNTTLFDRKTNNIITTETGLEVIKQAKIIQLHSKLLVDKAKSNSKQLSGKFKIGIIPTIANSLLPKIIKPILKNHPKLELDISEITTDYIIKQLKEGKIDAGILATPLNNEDIEENILYYETLMVYGKVEKNKKYIMPEELTKHKLWLLKEGHCLREQTFKLCSLKSRDNLLSQFKFEGNSFETLISMVDEFSGLTLIPELYYQTLSSEQKNKVIMFAKPMPVREVSMVYYRPYPKLRTINTISNDIIQLIDPLLLSNKMKKSELVIAKL